MELMDKKWILSHSYSLAQMGGRRFIMEEDIVHGPTVNARPCEKGEWEVHGPYEDHVGNQVYVLRHSKCLYETVSYTKEGTRFCPNCGDIMREE